VLVDKAGLLIDEQFGATILRDAKAKGFTMACPGLHRVRSGPDGVLETLIDWRAGKASCEQAVERIAGRYREFVDLFEEG
jgi:myo-inositol catabolism protein IolC